MSSAPTLSTTSYAILGLLAVKPWTTHELVVQVDRSLKDSIRLPRSMTRFCRRDVTDDITKLSP